MLIIWNVVVIRWLMIAFNRLIGSFLFPISSVKFIIMIIFKSLLDYGH